MPEKDASALKGKTGPRRLFNAFRYTCDGLAAAWRKEEAFRQESIIAAILAVTSIFLPASVEMRLLCLFSLAFVIVTELLNTGIEAAVDRIGSEIHPLSKVAKDMGSAAVFVSLALAAIVWAAAAWCAVTGGP